MVAASTPRVRGAVVIIVWLLFSFVTLKRDILATALIVRGPTAIFGVEHSTFLSCDVWKVIQSANRRLLPALSSVNGDTSSSDTSETDNRIRRKRRKNKYGNFSKVDSKSDPLEQMIAESREKNERLLEEQQTRKRKQRTKKRETDVLVPPEKQRSSLAFSDVKDIDPYDPTTFGYVEIGTLAGAHGVHGWIKVRSATDFPTERLCTAGIRHLRAPSKRAPRQVVLLDGRHRHGDEFLIRLDGVDDRDAASRLRGFVLYAREEEKLKQVDDEFIVSDLVGLNVFQLTNAEQGGPLLVGTVGGVVFAEDVTANAAGLGHDMLEILLASSIGGHSSRNNNKEAAMAPSSRRKCEQYVLVPFISQIVPKVDLKKKAVFIDPPAGLLDLTYEKEKRIRIKGFLPPAKGTTI